MSASRSKTDRVAYLYILPAFLFLGLFIFYGIGYNIFISLHKWDGVSLTKTWVGLRHYVTLLTNDPRFGVAVRHTIYLATATIGVSMVAGFVLAIFFMSLMKDKLQNGYKGLIFLPHVMSQVVVAITFRGAVLGNNFGFLNEILRAIGLDALALNWLGNISLALPSVTTAFIYTQIGFAMVIYYTSLLSLSTDVFEAARIDGASFTQIVWRIIIPILKNTHSVLFIFLIVNTLKQFDLVWMMTEGGPANATEIVSTYIYRQGMLFYNQGNTSAISTVALFFVLAFSAVVLSTSFAKNQGRGR